MSGVLRFVGLLVMGALSAGCDGSPTSTGDPGLLEVREYRLVPATECALCGGIDAWNEHVQPVLEARTLSWSEEPPAIQVRGALRRETEGGLTGTIILDGRKLILRQVRSEASADEIQADFVIELGDSLVYAFASRASPFADLVDAFFAHHRDWILEHQEDVVVSGASLNERQGADRTFGVSVLSGELLYFRERDGATRLVYSGVAGPETYEEISRGNCCELSIFNVQRYESFIRFFARREGDWYLVEAGLPTGDPFTQQG